MAKLRRKCEQCGRVKTVKYRWGRTNPNAFYYAWQGDGDTYFCSDECALKWFCGVSATKCACCEKPLFDGNGVFVKTDESGEYIFSPKIYCSIECYLADRNCLPVEEVNKEASHEMD